MRKAAVMREAALKSTIFVGVPRVCWAPPIFQPSLELNFFFRLQTIGALAGLTDALEKDVKAGLRTNSRRCGVCFAHFSSERLMVFFC